MWCNVVFSEAGVQLNWHKCYSEGWTGEIVPEAFSHPAKFARGLIRRIYAYAVEQGWLVEGCTVLDPFAGVALGGLDAMRHGLHWVGCELEEKFVDLGQQNIDLWNRRYSRMPKWGSAVLLQGDSRDLARVLAGARAEGIISSPPYAEQPISNYDGSMGKKWRETGLTPRQRSANGRLPSEQYGTDPAQLGNMPTGEPPSAVISSPPLGKAQSGGTSFWEGLEEKHGREFSDKVREGSQGYREDQLGDSDGQLGAMPTGEPPQAIISSPSYAKGCAHTGGEDPRPEHIEGGALRFVDYGRTDGQLAAMREGDVDAVIASPPYAQSRIEPGNVGNEMMQERWGKGRLENPEKVGYGQSPGQLAALPEGEPPSAILSSPPFASTLGKGGETKGFHSYDENEAYNRSKRDYVIPDAEGQLGAMQEGQPPEAIVSSPPYEGAISSKGHGLDLSKSLCQHDRLKHKNVSLEGLSGSYSESFDNLGNTTGDTFWSASRLILQQCYTVLAPGGHAIFVTKRFVRAKKIVDFSQQWADLCQSVGFELVEWIKAWLVEERGTQYDLEGNAHTKTVERKSFFRRLAERKGSPRIDWEDVLVFRKPNGEGGEAEAIISSPPWTSVGNYGDEVADIDRTASTIPSRKNAGVIQKSYGHSPGQLAEMKEGSPPQAIISSPPWSSSLATNVHTIRDIPGIEEHSHRKQGQIFPSEIKQEYGHTPGQLAGMKEGSPPTAHPTAHPTASILNPPTQNTA